SLSYYLSDPTAPTYIYTLSLHDALPILMTTITREQETSNLRVVENAHWQKPLYETHGLNLWYGTTHALKNIDLPIYEKEVTAIIGPSGCGKSTYLKTLNRMVEMNANVTINGTISLR